MNIIKIEVNELPEGCGDCTFKYHLCLGLVDRMGSKAYCPDTGRRPDCPLVVECLECEKGSVCKIERGKDCEYVCHLCPDAKPCEHCHGEGYLTGRP